jgi:DNA-directed RNA polymerase subunit RPC12/RpoP
VPIQVTCASCHAMFNAPDSAAGKTTACPKCGSKLVIPTPAADDDILEAEVAPSRPFSDEDFDPPASTAMGDGDRKPCPMCGELIQKDAVKCRHCGEIFDPLLKAQEQKKNKKSSAPGDGDLTTAEWVVAIVCSGIGCIMGIIWMIQGKPKGQKMLVVSLCAQGVWFLLRMAILALNQAH